MISALGLLRQRRFLPLFVTQFLGAFNDNLFKTAMVLFATYSIFADPHVESNFNALATGLSLIPFFLLSALSGQLADTNDKAKIIRIVKTAEIGIMLFGAGGLMAAKAGITTFGIGMMLAAVLFSPPINGVRRWFGIAGIGVQPSELAKIAVIIFTAAILERRMEHVDELARRGLGSLGLGVELIGGKSRGHDVGSSAVPSGAGDGLVEHHQIVAVYDLVPKLVSQ